MREIGLVDDGCRGEIGGDDDRLPALLDPRAQRVIVGKLILEGDKSADLESSVARRSAMVAP